MERKEVLSQIERDKIDNSVISKEDIYQLLLNLRKIDLMTQEGKYALIRSLMDHVLLFDQYLEIFLNFRQGKRRHHNSNSIPESQDQGQVPMSKGYADGMYIRINLDLYSKEVNALCEKKEIIRGPKRPKK